MISVIIPLYNKSKYIKRAVESILNQSFQNFEIIIVNQSGNSIDAIIAPYLIKFKEVVPEERLSAPLARNYGASFSEGQYLLFMDDDALFINMNYHLFNELIEILLQGNYSVYVAQRGEIVENNYLSHWPSQHEINIKNFPRFIIEWNIIIKKSLFNKIGGFYNIGPGSKHLAQAGEAFILIVRVLCLNFKVIKLAKILIAHPSLFQIDIQKQKKYTYGAGYAIGYSVQFMTLSHKIYWTLRAIASGILQPNLYNYKIAGLFDGLKMRSPRQSL